MIEKPDKYWAVALDPLHVGEGGYRLGGVDMTIVREPATGVPKVPGTSLAGAIREYSTVVKEEDEKGDNCFDGIEIDDVFGTADGGQGMLRFYDAQIILFPVHSIYGTVWVATKNRLLYWKINDDQEERVGIIDQELENKALVLKGIDKEQVNLGWLLLETKKIPGIESWPTYIPPGIMKYIQNIVVVSDKLFSHIVNDNLEIRTSIKIDRNTGAAKSGALFTYEAIPRGTIIGFEIAIDRRRGKGVAYEKVVVDLLQKSFKFLKLLGVGGMGTRGFGRLALCYPIEEGFTGGAL